MRTPGSVLKASMSFSDKQLSSNLLARLMEVPEGCPHASRQFTLQEKSSVLGSNQTGPKSGTWVTESWPVDTCVWKAEKPSFCTSS